MDIIKSIQIKNIKGIDDKTFNLNLIPNKPNLIVAHNGFGKSSFTAAFKSLQSNGIVLDFCDVHLMNNKLSPEINMIITQNRSNTNLTADNAKNEIKKYFDIVVINNPMVAKKRHTQSYTVAVLAIDDIIINNKIPLAANFEYEPKNISNLQNISELLNHQDLICDLKERRYYEKLRSKRKYQKIIAANKLFSKNKKLELDEINNLKTIEEIESIAICISKYRPLWNIEKVYIAAIELAMVILNNSKNFNKIKKYYNYLIEKRNFEENLKDFDISWINLEPIEERRKYLLRIPAANLISNGERDILCFITKLLIAEQKLKKEKNILIIDEIFDYLDEANLVTAQYYICKLIDKMKKQGKSIYPIIMTHLDPYLFNGFVFKKHKQKVHFLQTQDKCQKKLEKFLIDREINEIKDDISKYFLHYHPKNKNLTNQFNRLGLSSELANKRDFTKYINKELEKYKQGKRYDPLAVCCAVRINIEEQTYAKIKSIVDKNDFLEIYETRIKLDFAISKKIRIPEKHYILGLIYNEACHCKKNVDNFSRLYSKLNNLAIKSLITDL